MPFIPFKTRPGFYYVYDMNKNSIYKTNKQQYESLCKIQSGDGDSAVLEDFQKKGLLLDSPVVKVQHPASQFLEYQLKRCVNSVTFQMSQNCNLRCAYCPYSDNGIYDNRSRADKNIKWETVRKGIDFLIANSLDADNLHIAFYGGEPLIVKELIVRALKYAVEQINGKDISFGLTTNGTLLDHEFAEAVKNYNISILVSLDGPKEIHDKNRTYANGKSSYDVLYRNIKHIKENIPELYEKIKYNTVISPGSNYKEIFDYFRNNNEIFDLSKISFNELSMNYTDKTFSYGDAYFEEKNYETLKAYLLLLGKLKKEPVSYHKADIENIFSYKETFTPIKETPPVAHPNGTCIPGLKKLFIDVDGNFFPCERINENSALMRIGNVDDGFDVEKARELLNVGAVTEDACKNCWAFHCCTMCPMSSDNGKDKQYSRKYKLCKCKRVKAAALEKLKNYAILKEFKFQFNKEDLIS